MTDGRADSGQHSGTKPSHLLTGNVRNSLLILALPILTEQALLLCVGLVDTYLSGQISAVATSAVGTAAYIGWLASLLFGMIGTGTTALVSRAWGKGDQTDANRIANRSLAMAGVLAGGVCLLFYSAAPWLTMLLNMDDEQAAVAIRYIRIDAFGHLAGGFSLIGAAALRGAGDTRSPMYIIGFVSLMNLVASPILVFGLGPIPALQVDGIVFGTLIARVSGGILMMGALARGLSGLKLSLHEFRLRGKTVRNILRIGIPAALDGVLIWIAQMVFLKIINQIQQLEPGAYPAHMIGIQMEALTYLPAVAWGQAAATMVGQSLGAGDKSRAKRVGHEAAFQCGLLAVVITLLFFFGADFIYHQMHRDSQVRAVGIPAFRINALFQVSLAVSIVYVYALRGAGDTRYPLVINVLGIVGVRLPLAYYLGITCDLGLLGAWLGMGGDMTVRALLVTMRFFRGRWTEIAV
ncbi:MAG: MATE family efflux transporter [Planctomycetaceae bacterium]